MFYGKLQVTGDPAILPLSPKQIIYSVILTVFLSCVQSAAPDEMIPFVIPAQQDSASLIAQSSEPIEFDPAQHRVKVTGCHFTRGSDRINFWGVNMAFAGNLPSHADAPAVADRLAAAGINSVRIHLIDVYDYPSGIWDPTNPTALSADALDRLDYFIDQLARKGVYINLNLHVGREHSDHLGLPDPGLQYDKIVTIFTPQLINTQMDYAQTLLNHHNTYRCQRYADDPAIALVEISNENSFFMWGADTKLRNLPQYYADLLRQQYNSWLTDEYGNTDTLRNVWNANAEPLGENLLTSMYDHFNNSSLPPEDKWILEQISGCQADFEFAQYNGTIAARLTTHISSDTNWHLQLKQAHISLTAGQYYTISFDAAAEQPRPIWLNIQQDHDPWANLGFTGTANLTSDWQNFTFGFYANANDENARFSFAFAGDNTATWYLTNVQLRPGGQPILGEDESIEDGTVQLFVEREAGPRQTDKMRFLAQTEKSYFDSMRNYIKNDLGCPAPVTGTIVFGPLGLWAQSDMDFIDSHAYWKHPQFPNIPWDPADWYVEQQPMTDHIEQATLFALAGCRLGPSPASTGKPFTVTEYNHPAPLDSQVACIPMIASFAAAQDWDGVWIYSYAHYSDAWEQNYFSRYFDIIHNPAKWGFVPAAASIFKDRRLTPLGNTISAAALTDPEDPLPPLIQLHLDHDLDTFALLQQNTGISRQDLLNTRVVNTLFDSGTVTCSNDPNNTILDWQINAQNHGIYAAKNDRVHVYVGHKDQFPAVADSIIEVNEPNFLAITITPLFPDQLRNPPGNSPLLLITACGKCENTNMIFSADRTTVSTNWGQAPVRIEPVRAKIHFPFTQLTCHALSPSGIIQQSVPVSASENGTIIELSPVYNTMWYLVSISPDLDASGNIDLDDLAIMADYWLMYTPAADIEPLPFGNGVINLPDFAAFANEFNNCSGQE